MFNLRISILLISLLLFPMMSSAADSVDPMSGLTFGDVMGKLVDKEKESLLDTANQGLINLVCAIVSALGTLGSALIAYVFTFIRKKLKILKYTQLDENIEKKIQTAWTHTRQGIFKECKQLSGKDRKISFDDSKKCMSNSMQILLDSFEDADFKHLGINTVEEFKAWAKAQFEHVTDIAKGKIKIPIIGGKATVSIGKTVTPISGKGLVGCQISTKW